MTSLDKTDSDQRSARGFAVTDTSAHTFVDIHALLSRDNLSDWLLPCKPLTIGEKIVRFVSSAAGPVLVVAAYALLIRASF
ncbi:hypothetical protein [Sphingomonas sp. RB1R13]|uniref:hypothetical protein n=1 Tax=Sphingomonas sp. RB1R13 TaxID=3096159 RepID=UPI002FCBDAF6